MYGNVQSRVDGSWLDIAEIELSAIGRQCISNNRIPDLLSLQRLLEPWAAARNAAQKGVDWQSTADDDQLVAAQTVLRAEG